MLDVAIPDSVDEFSEVLSQSSSSLNAKLDASDENIEAGSAAFSDDLEEWISKVQSEMDVFDTEIQSRLQELDIAISGQLDEALGDSEKEVEKQSVKAVAAVTAASASGDKQISDLQAKLNQYKSKKAIMWVGGTKQGGSFSGARDLVMDRTDLDLSGDHFTIATKFITIKKAGVYRLNWWTNMYGRGCHAHTRVKINNKCATGYNYNSFSPYYGNYWRDMHVDFTWVFAAGDKVNMIVNSCSGGRGWNNNAKSNFLSFQYLGTTTAKPRATTRNC